MTNITFSVDNKLYTKMKKHPEIKWSEIFRKAIKDYLSFIERPKVISGSELFASINIPVPNYTQEKEIELRKKQQDLEKTRAKNILELESQIESE